jgi:hypothetical protein
MTTTVAVSCDYGDVLGGVLEVDDDVVVLEGTDEVVEESGSVVVVDVLVVDVVVEASIICCPNIFI